MRRGRLWCLVSSCVLTLSLAGGGVAAAAEPGNPTIIGGTNAPNVPWGAQVYVSDSFYCSGTIIASQWVLTARHCLGSSMSVRLGSNTLGEGVERTVDDTETAPSGDIALLHLSQAYSTTYMRLGDSDPSVGSTNSIYGWGRTCNACAASSQLKTATVEVIGSSTDAYGGPAIQSEEGDGYAWKGDSGGPQVASGVQVGVASTVRVDIQGNPIGVSNYSSVESSRSWIDTTIGA